MNIKKEEEECKKREGGGGVRGGKGVGETETGHAGIDAMAGDDD